MGVLKIRLQNINSLFMLKGISVEIFRECWQMQFSFLKGSFMITRKQFELLHYHFFSGLWLIVKEEKEREKMKKKLWQEFTLQKCFQIMP